jgi:chromosome segregation ATPase
MELKDSSVFLRRFCGLSLFISIGQNKGFRVTKDGPSLRVDLFWISFCIAWIDLENLIEGLLNELKDKDKKEKEVEKKSCNIDKLEQQNKDLEDQILILKNDRDAFKNGIEIANQQIKELRAVNERLEETNDNLNDELTDALDLANENEELEQKLEEALKDNLDLSKEIAELEAKLEENELYSSSSSSSESSGLL